MDNQTLILMLVPLILAEITMKVLALVNLSRQTRTRGPKLMWVLLILFLSIVGWAAYFAVGREDT